MVLPRREPALSLTEYLRQNWIEVVNDTIAHFDLTVVVMVIAVLIGVGVGVLTYQTPIFSNFSITTAAAFLTIPSFALLGILIPFLGLGYKPVLLALVLYALLPIIRNTVVGLSGVDNAMIEAARGLGMGKVQLLLRVRLPVAWPVILTGIRVSTQIVVGIAAIGAYVNGPGLGNEIFSGLARFGAVNSLNQVLIGTVLIVILAIIFDLAYQVVGRFTTSKGIRA
ncbi:MAG: ABC transporter permease [Propionibacteriaceae bacterium]